jgi:hypothetical protein
VDERDLEAKRDVGTLAEREVAQKGYSPKGILAEEAI